MITTAASRAGGGARKIARHLERQGLLGGGAPSAAQGRLTLSSGVPVMTSTVTGAGTVYYMPYVGSYVPLFDGTSWKMVDIGGQLSNVLANSSTGKAGPAAATTNSNYDLFVWDDAGTIRLTRGPLWTSDTGRGSGSGTTELGHSGNYILTNAQNISSGPAAGRGTYVGTIRTNGSSTTDYIFGGTAAGGTAGFFGVWNMYNRVTVGTMVIDNTDTWNYDPPSAAALRQSNNSSNMRVSYVCGLAEDAIDVRYTQWAGSSAADTPVVAIGVDSTTVSSGVVPAGIYIGSTMSASYAALYAGIPGQGFHYVAALESTNNGGSLPFYGDNGATPHRSGMLVYLRA